MPTKTGTITRNALIKRINRKLEPVARLRQARCDKTACRLGYYYTVLLDTGYVDMERVNLRKLGRELGVLAEGEDMAEAM